MNALQRLAASYPRTLYAIWNGATTLVPLVLFCYTVELRDHDAELLDQKILLVTLLPAICGAVSGAILGRQLLIPSLRADRPNVRLAGMLAAMLGYAMYVPVVTILVVISQGLSGSPMTISEMGFGFMIALGLGLFVAVPLAVISELSARLLRRLAGAPTPPSPRVSILSGSHGSDHIDLPPYDAPRQGRPR